MKSSIKIILGSVLLLSGIPVTQAADRDFIYTDKSEATTVIDTRILEKCEGASLPNARCLPAASFLGPHGRLANFRDILWLLGTVGLDGHERVLVIGNNRTEKDFVAGLLYLAGQAKVEVLTKMPPPSALTDGGTGRSITREKIFQAPMRDQLLILRDELATLLKAGEPLALLDGRSEDEYWGERVRSIRGGHLPGASQLPINSLRRDLKTNTATLPSTPDPIAYAHNARQGIAYFTLLHAGAGVNARVFPGGWAAWAVSGNLPADNASYPDARSSTVKVESRQNSPQSNGFGLMIVGLAVGGLLTSLGFFMGKRRTA
ncbi:MAG: hypothetical protein COB59_01460 [Rhodospirillaceae bacterium]|nr:MAG: hypothetical protein COB59_01460 [Rhodospirillaceae bacterium]